MTEKMSVWDYENEDQKQRMEEPITPQNCGRKLVLVREVSGISRRQLAEAIGCSESTIARLETGKTTATVDFIQRLQGLAAIGFAKFSKLSSSEKDSIGSVLGAAGGTTAGIGASIASVSIAGSVGGLSASGITSGLAAIGGGSMMTGVGVIAAIPLAVGLAGFGIVKGIQKICEANNLGCIEVDGKFEIVKEPTNKQQNRES